MSKNRTKVGHRDDVRARFLISFSNDDERNWISFFVSSTTQLKLRYLHTDLCTSFQHGTIIPFWQIPSTRLDDPFIDFDHDDFFKCVMLENFT